jgi:hypothetical protein
MGADNGAQDDGMFDLDVLERDVTPEPFRFRLGGQTWTMADPPSMDWKAGGPLNSGDPLLIMETFLGPEQWERFKTLDMPGWKLDRLFRAWGAHFGVEIPESQASPPSSKPTGVPSRPISVTTTASASPTLPPAD